VAHNPDGPALSDVLAELASAAADPFDVAELVHVACQRSCEVLGCDGAIILLSVDGVALDVAGAVGLTGDIDRICTIEPGPCREAIATSSVVRFADEVPDAFPEYAATVSAFGFRRTMSVPLRHGESIIGTLTLVRCHPTDFSTDTEGDAVRVADVVASSIVRGKALQEALAVRSQLEHALTARVVVEQAKGMAAAELRVSVEEAAELIRAFARDRRIRMAEVAADIVERTLPIALLRRS
jgi:GAF domain-containing protein